MSSGPDTAHGPEAGLVLRRLRRRLPVPDKPRLDPLDELVLTILSQSTTDANRDHAWRNLAERFPRTARTGEGPASEPGHAHGPVCWDAVRRGGSEVLEAAVRVAGLANQKVPAILHALDRLASEVGALTLDHLEEMDDGEAITYLTTFRGVGVKTAACVLCFSLRRPILPVDTHVLRIARRLAWVPPRASADHAHRVLAGRVAAEDRFRMHMLLITFGRTICLARRPRCGECPLGAECPRVGVQPPPAAAR